MFYAIQYLPSMDREVLRSFTSVKTVSIKVWLQWMHSKSKCSHHAEWACLESNDQYHRCIHMHYALKEYLGNVDEPFL